MSAAATPCFPRDRLARLGRGARVLAALGLVSGVAGVTLMAAMQGAHFIVTLQVKDR